MGKGTSGDLLKLEHFGVNVCSQATIHVPEIVAQ